jgi:nitroreductase
LGSNSDA